MCLVNCVVQIFLRLYFSFETSKLVRRSLPWGWTCTAAPVIFTVLVPGGAEQVWAAREGHSQPPRLFGCWCLMEAEGQVGTVPVTCDTHEEGADGPLHSHINAPLGLLLIWAAPGRAPAESKELPPHLTFTPTRWEFWNSQVTGRSVCIPLQNCSTQC